MTCRVAAAVVFAIALGLLAGPSQACYTGLTIIPTAETVGEGYYGIEAQVDGPVAGFSAPTRILNTEVGLGSRLEAGVDFDLSRDAPTTLLLNAKWLLMTRETHRTAVALGVCNVGRHLISSPYAVATRELGSLRGHLGLMGIEGENHWFVGVDRELSSGPILMADYTEGAGNYASAGVAWELGGPWSMTAGVQFPNSRGDDTLWTVHVVISASYRSAQGGG